MRSLTFLVCCLAATSLLAQPVPNSKFGNQPDYFRQLEEWLPTPNVYRTAAGEPGPQYWQQRADYEIDVTLDDKRQRLEGTVRIHYHNRSPHSLRYVWLQLDQNIFRPDSDAVATAEAPSLGDRVQFNVVRSLLARETFEGGYKISRVADGEGNDLPYTVVKTMMRIDLPEPVEPGQSTRLAVDYGYNIVNSELIRARSGYEYFEDDDNYIYEIAQWFPRAVAFTDYTGWQHKQFLGRGEFALELGDYKVRITAPADHVVAATGVLQNPSNVLTDDQRTRLEEARKAEEPIFIITPEEAKENEKSRSKKTKTWEFHADNVRDFAFASSRKFIWDAVGHGGDDDVVMAMSYYPNEAEPLWSQYSTHAIVHTLEVYSRYTFEYPYPTAISVNGPVYGMEYPMICFNGPRPEEDGTYSKRTKYALISVIIHEVGHNYFPMIVNSDERQWTWMDEGLNTFLQYVCEQEWEEDYPSRRGEPQDIVGYMRSSGQVPIMTNSESIHQFGNNAYSKPATALNVLRETILGRELFDFAFKEYARRWKFRRPTPADFFRTMEDASGVDLDWFWRGWFYSTDHVDIGIDSVKLYVIDSGDPDEASDRKRRERKARPKTLSQQRNADLPKRLDLFPGLKDFYNTDYDDLEVTEESRKAFQRFVEGLSPEEKKLLKRKSNFYVVQFSNVGGVVMPIVLEIHYEDGSSEVRTYPAEIWRRDGKRTSKLIISDKTIQRLELDPFRQTADAGEANNHWPPKLVPSRFKLFKSDKSKNEMQKAKDREKKAEKE
ncbi:M1 family metallopeptidase [Roseimaritima sediminicola]|uniref:M1 family metallopeptidase n=1 Tax=Roseimaritima sediminicola TaxID=2662066 RepID=UPI0012984DA8|nr:M1 family metallopeptidase [Roseimaritima sediminicola]